MLFNLSAIRKIFTPIFYSCSVLSCAIPIFLYSPTSAKPTHHDHDNHLSQHDCAKIMEDVEVLQIVWPNTNYKDVVRSYRKKISSEKQFANDPRMEQLFDETAQDPHSAIIHRKIFNACGSKNFYHTIRQNKKDAEQYHIPYRHVDWKM